MNSWVVRCSIVAALGLGFYWVYELQRLGDFPFDDTYITLRYAKHFAEHGHLSFNLDDRVDGFTSQGWTVLLAIAMKLGAGGIQTAVFLSRLCGYLGGISAAVLALCLGAPPMLALCAAGLTLSSGDWMTWSAPGMETPYAGLCAALLLADVARHALPGRMRIVALIAVFTARPDCGVLVAIVVIHDAIRVHRCRDTGARRDALSCLAVAVGVMTALFVAHWVYYGYPLPNTYYAKLSGVRNFERGIPDFTRFLATRNIWVAPVAAVMLIAVGRPAQRVPCFAFLTWFVACFYSYAAAGGDYMDGFRFYQPLVPAAWAMAFTGLDCLIGSKRSRPARTIVGCIAVLATGWLMALGHKEAPSTLARQNRIRFYAKRWSRAGEALARCFPTTTSMSIRAAGVIPYLTDFRAYDTLGLNTREVVLHPGVVRPKDVGHNKEASPDQVVAWRPDLVVNHPHFSTSDETGTTQVGTEPAYVAAGYRRLCLRIDAEYFCPLARPGVTSSCAR